MKSTKYRDAFAREAIALGTIRSRHHERNLRRGWLVHFNGSSYAGDRYKKRAEQELERAKRLTPAEVEVAAQKVDRKFLKKLLKHLSRLNRKFVVNLLSAYFALRDPDTPLIGKAAMALVLLYFINPFDLIPDLIPIFGFADDAGVLWAAWKFLSTFISDKHRTQAADWLDS